MAARDIRTCCRVSDGADALLRTAITRLALSARAYHRILKIARTLADLEGAADLQPKHVSEAIQYRSLDRRGLAERKERKEREDGSFASRSPFFRVQAVEIFLVPSMREVTLTSR